MDVLDDLPFWYTFAACLGKFGRHDDPWFDHENYNIAIEVCEGCPVRDECLDRALRTHPQEDAGIWGGTTARERERLRKAARTAA